MPVSALHLHTYFLFPFSIDKEAVLETDGRFWPNGKRWIDGLDEWLRSHHAPFLAWERAAYSSFDMNSPAYQDMVFFHPVVRRVFFDTAGHAGSEALLRCYVMRPPAGSRMMFEAEDAKGRSAAVEVTDLRLFLFANGIGILSIGVDAHNIPVKQALWINEAMRKVYPSSGRQVREGRSPNRMTLALDRDGVRTVLAEERFDTCCMVGFQPPLAWTVSWLLYFCDYSQQEYEPVLDERMIVYTYLELDPSSLPSRYIESNEYQVLLSRLLWVENEGDDYRYEPEFIAERMRHQLYRRWAHEGTYYGFTSYSNATTAIGKFDCGDHQLQEGFLIHRMFNTRYYLMAIVSLFYRATLLDFSENTALVSRRLYQLDARLTPENVRMAEELRSDFLQFSNYWHFTELANKEEELEHFRMQCREYRIEQMKAEIGDEVESLEASVQRHYQHRNTEAINRVAMLSLIFGLGAMLTGFFGMNFAGAFGDTFFQDMSAMHYVAIAVVVVFTIGAFGLSAYVVISNWSDYRRVLNPSLGKGRHSVSLRRDTAPPR